MKRMIKRIVSGLFVYAMVRMIVGFTTTGLNETYALIALFSGTYLICNWMVVSSIQKEDKARMAKQNKYKKRKVY